ncbi:MAG TPA: MmcQ/YjbR family DNA-binding protein [Acidobacteriota bacterium]|jgi:hypothetical protein
MDIEMIRRYCLSLPHATEDIQWGSDLLFRIGGKIFAVIDMSGEQAGGVSFKCDPETFAELIETEGIRPRPLRGPLSLGQSAGPASFKPRQIAKADQTFLRSGAL